MWIRDGFKGKLEVNWAVFGVRADENGGNMKGTGAGRLRGRGTISGDKRDFAYICRNDRLGSI